MMGPVNQQPPTNHLPTSNNSNHHSHPQGGGLNDLLIGGLGGASSTRLPTNASHSPSMETPAVAASHHLLLDQVYCPSGSFNGGGGATTMTTAAVAAAAAAAAAANSYYHHNSSPSAAMAGVNDEVKPNVDVLSKLNSYSTAASWAMMHQQPHPSLYSTPVMPPTNHAIGGGDAMISYAAAAAAATAAPSMPFGCHYPLPAASTTASFNSYCATMNGFNGAGHHTAHGTSNTGGENHTQCHSLYRPFLNGAGGGSGGDHLSSMAALALNGGVGHGNATVAALNQSLFQQCWRNQTNGGNGYGATMPTMATPVSSHHSSAHLQQHPSAHASETKPAVNGNGKLKGVDGVSRLTMGHNRSSAISRGVPPYPTGRGTNNVRVRTSDKYRTVYTEPQRFELEKEFRSNEFIASERKGELSTYLQLTERQIKIWFQNRRAKERKQKNIVTRKGYR